MNKLKVGFLINPYAGIGGPLGFKGSDLIALQLAAADGEIPLRAPERAKTFWQFLSPILSQLDIITAPGSLGSDWLNKWNIDHNVAQLDIAEPTTANDTQNAAIAIRDYGIDLLVFVGGDGTARDIFTALGESALVLGVPSGVKMHSAVYAINPQSAAQLILNLVAGQLIAESLQEVRDIDEDLFREGIVKAQFFGQMRVPSGDEFVQTVKQGGIASEEFELMDIAAFLKEKLNPEALIIWAPGSTTLGVLREWGYEGTLLGVDILTPANELLLDVNSETITKVLSEFTGAVELVLTAIGGQGHIIGRGNQQFSVQMLERISRNHLHVIATKEKLLSLGGRPLLMDSGSPELDSNWSGLISVITGYQQTILYAVGNSIN